MYLNIRGIVIRETLLSESDKYISVFTQSDGVLSVKAKGITKTKSKSCAACQLFCYSDFVLYKKNEHYTLTEAVPVESFAGLQQEPVKFSLAAYLCDLTELVSRADQIPEETLRLLLNMLYALASGRHQLELICSVFEARTLQNAGFMPELELCGECGNFLEKSKIHYSSGEFICSDCFSLQNSGFPVHNSVLSALSYILTAPLKQVLNFHIADTLLLQLGAITESMVERNIGGTASRNYYKEMKAYGNRLPVPDLQKSGSR